MKQLSEIKNLPRFIQIYMGWAFFTSLAFGLGIGLSLVLTFIVGAYAAQALYGGNHPIYGPRTGLIVNAALMAGFLGHGDFRGLGFLAAIAAFVFGGVATASQAYALYQENTKITVLTIAGLTTGLCFGLGIGWGFSALTVAAFGLVSIAALKATERHVMYATLITILTYFVLGGLGGSFFDVTGLVISGFVFIMTLVSIRDIHWLNSRQPDVVTVRVPQ